MLLLLLACSLPHTLSQKLCHFLKFWWEKFIGNHCFIFQKKRYLPIGMYVLLELIWNLFDVSPFKMFIDVLDVAGLYMIGYGQEKIFWKSPSLNFEWGISVREIQMKTKIQTQKNIGQLLQIAICNILLLFNWQKVRSFKIIFLVPYPTTI